MKFYCIFLGQRLSCFDLFVVKSTSDYITEAPLSNALFILTDAPAPQRPTAGRELQDEAVYLLPVCMAWFKYCSDHWLDLSALEVANQ